jgi:site-specific recombinase XerC
LVCRAPSRRNPRRASQKGFALRPFVRFTNRLTPCAILTLDDIDRYIRHLTDDLRRAPSTINGYRSELRLLIARQVPPEPEPVAAFVTRTPSGELLAPNTRNRRLAILRGFFAFLVTAGDLAGNPTDEIRCASVPLQARTTLSADEIGDVAATLLAEPDTAIRTRDLCILLVLFYTGLRVSEVVHLDVSQVDLANGLLRGATRKGGGRTDVATTGKRVLDRARAVDAAAKAAIEKTAGDL